MRIGIANAAMRIIAQIERENRSRAAEASNAMRTASIEVLRGQRGGRVYKLAHKNTTYAASAPGEPPAVRTGTLMKSWRPVQSGNNPAIESNVPYAGYMEEGTPGGKIAPRPYAVRIIEKAWPEIEGIYSAPYRM